MGIKKALLAGMAAAVLLLAACQGAPADAPSATATLTPSATSDTPTAVEPPPRLRFALRTGLLLRKKGRCTRQHCPGAVRTLKKRLTKGRT